MMVGPQMAPPVDAGLGDEDLLAGLDMMDVSMLDDGGTVTCRVCQSQIDTGTGEPLTPVTADNVFAVEQFQGAANGAMMGGVEMDLDGGPVI